MTGERSTTEVPTWEPQERLPQSIDGVPEFWSLVSDARTRALFLDFDGTLAPFAEDRHKAYPLEGVPALLDRINDSPGTSLVIVSGRPVSEIQRLLDRDTIPIVGTHGFEYFRPGHGIKIWDLSPERTKVLDLAEIAGQRIAGEDRVERKVATVALHTRGLPVEDSALDIQAFESEIKLLIEPGDFEIRRFDGGTELRALGRDKGAAVSELITRTADVDFVVYVGDDDTDEDAFRALPEFGIGIKVGSPGVATAAQGRLSTCEAVRQFLWTWTQIDTVT